MNRLDGCVALVTAILAVGGSTVGECAQAANMRVLSPPAAAKTMQATKDGQPVSAETRNVKIAFALPGGREVNAYVLMVREPKSGLYWWTYQEVSPGGPVAPNDEPPLDYLISFTGDRTVGFTFNTPFLGIREVQGRQPDFTAIQKTALSEIERSVRAIEDGSMRWVRQVNVTPQLNRDFMAPAGSAAFFPQPTVKAVDRSGGQWIVTLEGPNRDFARLTLDDQYRLLNVSRQPAGK